jgi:predicted CxxxxCH...CXXCH cytochrome family protein
MAQSNTKTKILTLLFLALANTVFLGGLLSAGCSSGNKDSLINPDTGTHSATWYVDHRAAFLTSPAVCATCHGTDLRNGISGVSCFSASLNGLSCHANGPSGHPVGWALPGSHGAAAKSAPNPVQDTGFSTCQICHASSFTGGLSNQTCLNTAGCHGATVAAPHSPTPWRGGARTHITTNALNASVCGLCHLNGANSSVHPNPPAPGGTPPGCFNNTLCHGDQAGVCGSCHAIPPSGASFPNIAGGHGVHNALAPITGNCNVCHTGAGTGTALHQNGTAEVVLPATYNANSGGASFNGTTCSSIICHGSSRAQTTNQANANPPQSTPGQTPAWRTGTINVNTQCTLCHVLGPSISNPEITSYYSGRHKLHVYDKGRACTDCHDTTKLATAHFNSFTAPISSPTASASIKNAVRYNGASCNPSAGGITGCHGSENW